ncbi:MAG: molybdopterin molybdotransferase MoeA [Chloroflexi bacterium]|nr:molybdopterin molybdotransferase MoeA [Chloroflexota bacterium]
MNYISVEDARAYILKHFAPLEPERVPMLEALDRVLAEDVISELNVPPFNNSAMDGYAVRAADIVHAAPDRPAALRVIGDVAAGYVATRAVEPGTAMRIMTGAPLPSGADTVVRFEETSEGVETRGTGKDRDTVEILKAVQRGDNVRAAGEDIHAGEVVLPRGTLVRPPEIGVMASVGKKEVAVHRRPRVAILATGDELVDIDEPITPGKIRNSNEYGNAAAVVRAGGIPIRLGIARDNIADLTSKIRAGLDAGADLFLTSAGVSVGDYDMVKDVLNAEGAMHFWQVNMKPGKPLAFGVLRGKKDVPLLGLPGNPVSAMMSFEIFARPAILTMLGKTRFERPTVQAVLEESVTNTANRRNFIRVRVEKRDGGYVARTTGEQGSGILTSVSRANGLLVIPEDVTLVRAGDRVDIQMLDWPEW